jgi:hypothetical protein
MDVSLMTRMKEPEEETRRLKKLYIEAQIKADIVAEALVKNLKPSCRREVVRWARLRRKVLASVWRAKRLL